MKREALAVWASHAGRILVLATLALAPTQWGFRLGGAHLSVVDPLLGLAALFWVAKLILLREWSRLAT